MDFATIAALRKYLTIKHSLPGRIRIKFAVAIMDDPEALELAKNAPAMPTAVTRAKVNIFSRTLLLEYDATLIAPALLEELVATKDSARAIAIVKQLHAALYP